MSSNINIRDFLHDVLANKSRARLTIDEFDSILDLADQIQKFSQKGLLIVTLTQQLQKMSNVNYASIKKFMNDFLAGLRPQKPRRQREEGSRKKQRKRPGSKSREPKNLNRMAQQSVSNPSNLQGARIADIHSQGSDSNTVSQNASKKSDQHKRDAQFVAQLNKITQQMEIPTDQYENNFVTDEHVEQMSRASSLSSGSSHSFGDVSNLSQKMDLLTRRDRDKQKKTKTTAQKSTALTMTKTKYGKKTVLDENLTLQKTNKFSLNQSTFIQERSLHHEQYAPWINHYHSLNSALQQAYESYQKQIKDKPLSLLDSITLSARKQPKRQIDTEIPVDMAQFEGEPDFQESMPDFFSQPLAQEELQQNIPSEIRTNIIFGDASQELNQISIENRKPIPLLFYEMLARMQNGEIIMTQEDVQDFGKIMVEKVY